MLGNHSRKSRLPSWFERLSCAFCVSTSRDLSGLELQDDSQVVWQCEIYQEMSEDLKVEKVGLQLVLELGFCSRKNSLHFPGSPFPPLFLRSQQSMAWGLPRREGLEAGNAEDAVIWDALLTFARKPDYDAGGSEARSCNTDGQDDCRKTGVLGAQQVDGMALVGPGIRCTEGSGQVAIW